MATVVVILAAVLPYLPTLGDYFIQDDFGVVWLFAQRSPLHFVDWFTGPWTEDIWGYVPDEVRPFPALSYSVMAWFGSGSPVANHVLNITLHAANATLVMGLARWAAGVSLPGAALAGLVFAVMPIQAESVAWVTGRVDSLPAFFYLASFATFVLWRSSHRTTTYAWSVALCFMALFSKQNTITLGPALVLYDLMVARQPVRVSWSWFRPYAPFAALTAGFLLLRFVLFNEVAREGILNSQRVSEFFSDTSRHLVRLALGDSYMRTPALQAALIVAVVLLAVWLLARRGERTAASSAVGPAVYFGGAWIALGVAPILMAGYYSPRHMYLASAGWAVLVGTVFDVLWTRTSPRLVRQAVAVGGAALVVFYAVQLRVVVRDWNQRGVVSRQAVIDLEREVASLPEGTLVILGVPGSSWGYSVPYSARPPFTSTDLTTRVRLVSDSVQHCCPVHLWEAYTRQTLREWLARPDRPPVVALNWNARTAAMSRLTEQEEPYLRPLMQVWLATDNRVTLNGAIHNLLNNHVAPRPPVRRPN
ncbi:MAG: hypothetical protein ABL986_05130 [Vicinamibacterales bacterium]